MSSLRDDTCTLDEIDSTINSLTFATGADLKHLIVALNKYSDSYIARTGKKQELIDRATTFLRKVKVDGAVRTWRDLRPNVRSLGLLVEYGGRGKAITSSASAPTYPLVGPSTLSISAPARPVPLPTPQPKYRFQPSPFFTVIEPVSVMHECRESLSQTDRREAVLHFNLSAPELAKIATPSHQVRLFCTSSTYYSPIRPTNPIMPIEFPATCEVFINDIQIKASLKGMKKKPGTAPPPNLGIPGAALEGKNEIRMLYINAAPVNGNAEREFKKFYLLAQLVEMHPIETLVKGLRQAPAQEIRRQMRASMTADDEIIAGTLKLPLKCPLSFARISLPCRSSRCKHSQCFDASSWFAVMEQTTTWMCPICENVLDWKELIVDGFFSEILALTPSSVDDVLLEADGTWRTPDGKYSSTNPFSGKQDVEVICLDDDD